MNNAGKLPLVVAVIALLLLAAAGLGSHAGLWHFRTGFSMLKWAAYLGIAAALVALVLLLVAKVRVGNTGALAAALVLGIVAAGLPYSWFRKAQALPKIHDITTDTANPPVFVAVLPLRKGAANPAEYGGPPVADAQKSGYPDIRPLTLTEPPESAFARALAQAKTAGWEIVAADPAAGRIEATDTTRWFGFKDDIVVRITPEGTGSRVDVRSVSRVGKSDVGKNAARIRAYLAKLAR